MRRRKRRGGGVRGNTLVGVFFPMRHCRGVCVCCFFNGESGIRRRRRTRVSRHRLLLLDVLRMVVV